MSQALGFLIRICCSVTALASLITSAESALAVAPPQASVLISHFTNHGESKQNRIDAMHATVNLGPERMYVIAPLISILTDAREDTDIREIAVEVLVQLGPEAKSATAPILADLLRDKSANVDLRETAVLCIERSPSEAGVVLRPLIEILNDEHEGKKIRMLVATALKQIGSEARAAMPAIIKLLRDSAQDSEVRQRAADAVPGIDKKSREAIEALTEILKETNHNKKDLIATAASSLGFIGQEARSAAPALLEALKRTDGDSNVRASSASALGEVAREWNEAVPILVGVLQNKNEDRKIRKEAAYALRNFKSGAQRSVPVLAEVLRQRDEDTELRMSAVIALGELGAEAKSALPAIVDQTKDDALRRPTTEAIVKIARALQEKNDIDAIPILRTAAKAVEESSGDRKPIDLVVQALENAEKASTLTRTIEYVRGNKLLLGLALYLALAPFITLMLLWLRPLLLLEINQSLRAIEFPLDYIGLKGVKAPARYILVVGMFHYHKRVLNAWIANYIGSARQEFEGRETVRERSIYVRLPARIESGDHVEVTPPVAKTLQPLFKRKCPVVLIHGEGGSGKTTLAYQLARLAMLEQPSDRLCPDHMMIPVLIERDLNYKEGEGIKALMSEIRGQLREVVDEQDSIPEELVERLLRSGRILVIVDHLSEMNDATRDFIRPGNPDFPANALIVTSRIRERLDGVSKATIEPLRIEGNRISVFMDAYLVERGKRGLFEDREYFSYCVRLASLAGVRNITVLLAKLYVEQVILFEESDRRSQLPENIPDLMLNYLNQMNLAIQDGKVEDRLIHHYAKVSAWECLKSNYRPGTVSRNDLITALGRQTNPEVVIAYLDKRLGLLETIGADKDRVRFCLDPLAEYLAALYLLDRYRGDEHRWNEFFKRADEVSDSGDAIRGFLLAVQDCCLFKATEIRVPDFVMAQLAARSKTNSEPQINMDQVTISRPVAIT